MILRNLSLPALLFPLVSSKFLSCVWSAGPSTPVVLIKALFAATAATASQPWAQSVLDGLPAAVAHVHQPGGGQLTWRRPRSWPRPLICDAAPGLVRGPALPSAYRRSASCPCPPVVVIHFPTLQGKIYGQQWTEYDQRSMLKASILNCRLQNKFLPMGSEWTKTNCIVSRLFFTN